MDNFKKLVVKIKYYMEIKCYYLSGIIIVYRNYLRKNQKERKENYFYVFYWMENF